MSLDSTHHEIVGCPETSLGWTEGVPAQVVQCIESLPKVIVIPRATDLVFSSPVLYANCVDRTKASGMVHVLQKDPERPWQSTYRGGAGGGNRHPNGIVLLGPSGLAPIREALVQGSHPASHMGSVCTLDQVTIEKVMRGTLRMVAPTVFLRLCGYDTQKVNADKMLELWPRQGRDHKATTLSNTFGRVKTRLRDDMGSHTEPSDASQDRDPEGEADEESEERAEPNSAQQQRVHSPESTACAGSPLVPVSGQSTHLQQQRQQHASSPPSFMRPTDASTAVASPSRSAGGEGVGPSSKKAKVECMTRMERWLQMVENVKAMTKTAEEARLTEEEQQTLENLERKKERSLALEAALREYASATDVAEREIMDGICAIREGGVI